MKERRKELCVNKFYEATINSVDPAGGVQSDTFFIDNIGSVCGVTRKWIAAFVSGAK